MKVALVYNDSPKTLRTVERLQNLLVQRQIAVDQKHPDLVLSIGGDGTMLYAFHKYLRQIDQVNFVGVHTGHLGFYTDWWDYELPDMVNALRDKKPTIDDYPLLEIRVTDNKQTQKVMALNEATMRGIVKTFAAQVELQGRPFESFRGDGLCVSTPTGSTAYNKSLGGAVIQPSLRTMQLAEIASLNNRVFRTLSAPLVVAPDETITIKPDHPSDITIVVDGRKVEHERLVQVEFKISKHAIRFARYRPLNFWNRVHVAFIGQN
ncbi:MAG: NAD kinase [Lactobacillus sp.]